MPAAANSAQERASFGAIRRASGDYFHAASTVRFPRSVSCSVFRSAVRFSRQTSLGNIARPAARPRQRPLRTERRRAVSPDRQPRRLCLGECIADADAPRGNTTRRPCERPAVPRSLLRRPPEPRARPRQARTRRRRVHRLGAGGAGAIGERTWTLGCDRHGDEPKARLECLAPAWAGAIERRG